MSSAPDCAVLKANFPAIYANRRRLRIKDPECKDFIHLVGTCEYGKSPTTGYSTRLNTVTIGRIYGDQPNGVGKIEFNNRFLREHPEYADVDVYRLNNRPAGVLVVPKGTKVTPQDLAQAVYDEIRNTTEDQYISPRDQTKLSAILDHATTNVDTEEIKERNQLYRRRSTLHDQTPSPRNSSYPQSLRGDLKLKIHTLGQQNRQLLEILEQPNDRDAFEPILGRQEALKSFLAKHGLTLERNFDLSQYLADKYCVNFPELKAELQPLLAQLTGPDCNFLKLPWQITSILPLPNLPDPKTKSSTASGPSLEDLAQHGLDSKAEPKGKVEPKLPLNGRSIGATLSLDVLLSQHPIDKAMPELVPTEEDSQLLASLIITSALSPNFKIVDFNEVLDSYELPYDGIVNAKQLHLLNASLTEPELECFWRSHNEAVFQQLNVTQDKGKKRESGDLTPMIYDIRLAAAIDPAMESAKRRLLAQHTAEMLLAVLNEADSKGVDATDALKELDAQAAHLASNIAATLTTPPVPSPALQLAALALPKEGALCYCSPYEGELTGASSVLYVKGAGLCPQDILPDDAMSVAAPLMVMARPDLTYSMILSKMRTWRAQGQRMLMELDPLNTKIRQICGNHFMDGTVNAQGTKFHYHGMTITALKLNVSWHDLYGLEPASFKAASADHESASSKEPNWYLYLYFNAEHYERLKQIMMLNTAKVNEQHEKSQLDLIVSTDEEAATELDQVEQHVNEGLKTPLKDQMFQCFSDHSTELNENFDLYCAEHSFKVVLSSEDLPEDLVFAALEQRHQLEQRVRAQCTVSLDGANTTLTPWPQLGSLVALLGQELYESVEQAVADYHAHHLRNPITLPDKSVALMLLSLASLKVKDPKAKFSLKAELNRTLIPAERKFLELLGLDVASTLGPKA